MALFVVVVEPRALCKPIHRFALSLAGGDLYPGAVWGAHVRVRSGRRGVRVASGKREQSGRRDRREKGEYSCTPSQTCTR